MIEQVALLVIGAGPAGLSAARGYRDAGGEGAVALVADEERMPYRRPPLTKELLRGEIDERELALEDETWLAANGASLICGRAVALSPDEHVVTIAGGRQMRYARCVLATGAEPIRLSVPGSDDPGVRVVRSLDHVRELMWRLRPGDRAIVVGSGFIGCEIAASLAGGRGHRVSMISQEALPNERRLGPEPAQAISRWLADIGVETHFETALEMISRSGPTLRVTAGDARAEAEVVIMAAGVVPRTELLSGVDIDLSDGAVPVDAGMRTALPDLLAAGDVCHAHNAAAGRPLRVEHWGDALDQGEIAGRTAAGQDARWDAVPGFWSTIGAHTLKYAAWGDGYDTLHVAHGPDGGFTAWYGSDGVIVGVLAHGADGDYEHGRELVAAGAGWPF